MKDRDIISMLIPIYIESIFKVENTEYDFLKYYRILRELHTDLGVCNCVHHTFNIDVCERPWVKRHLLKHHVVWGPFPLQGLNKDGVLEALNLRLNILKEEYAEVTSIRKRVIGWINNLFKKF